VNVHPGWRLNITFLRKISFLFLSFLHCAYFNLFYNARSNFKEGERLLTSNPTEAKARFNKAKEKCLLLIKKYPRSRWTPEALYLSSLCHFYLDENEKAKERFSLFLSLYPHHKLSSRTKFYLALTYLKTGERNEGILLLRQLSEEDKREEKRAKLAIYSALIQSGESSLILDSLKRFLVENPRGFEADSCRLLLGELYFSRGDYQKSRASFEDYLRVVKDNKRKIQALLRIGEALFREGAPKETLSQFLDRLHLVDEVPERKAEVDLLRGKILQTLGEEEKAVSLLKGLRTAESYFTLGEYYERKGEFRLALSYYDTAHTLSPTGDFGLKAERKEKLLTRFLQAESLSPALRDFALGELYLLSLKRPDLALREYEKVFRQYPEDSLAPKSLYACAWIKKFILSSPDADSLFSLLIRTYPETEYAREGAMILKKKE
jgi:tetratricopeptide (TPR) repeat protein